MPRLRLDGVRFSYLTVFEPKAFQPGDPLKFSVQVLVPKDNEAAIAALEAAIAEAKAEAPKGKRVNKTPLRDGDTDPAAKEETAGYMFFNSSCYADRPPKVVGRARQDLNPDQIKSGDWGNWYGSVYYTDKGGAKIASGLTGVQLVTKGDPLGSTVDVEDMFDELEPLTSENVDEDEMFETA